MYSRTQIAVSHVRTLKTERGVLAWGRRQRSQASTTWSCSRACGSRRATRRRATQVLGWRAPAACGGGGGVWRGLARCSFARALLGDCGERRGRTGDAPDAGVVPLHCSLHLPAPLPPALFRLGVLRGVSTCVLAFRLLTRQSVDTTRRLVHAWHLLMLPSASFRPATSIRVRVSSRCLSCLRIGGDGLRAHLAGTCSVSESCVDVLAGQSILRDRRDSPPCI